MAGVITLTDSEIALIRAFDIVDRPRALATIPLDLVEAGIRDEWSARRSHPTLIRRMVKNKLITVNNDTYRLTRRGQGAALMLYRWKQSGEKLLKGKPVPAKELSK